MNVILDVIDPAPDTGIPDMMLPDVLVYRRSCPDTFAHPEDGKPVGTLCRGMFAVPARVGIVLTVGSCVGGRAPSSVVSTKVADDPVTVATRKRGVDVPTLLRYHLIAIVLPENEGFVRVNEPCVPLKVAVPELNAALSPPSDVTEVRP